MTVAEWDALPAHEAAALMERCCGASAWVRRMVAARPLRDLTALLRASDEAWSACGPVDFKEAFAHHPRIGDIGQLAQRFASTREWASGEQRGVEGAPRAVLERLAAGNRDYEARFGYIFIVCASGLSAGEMLERLEARLGHDPETELGIAAGEQHRITRLRLGRLFS